MANITLFSFQLNSTTRITVYRDSVNPTAFDYTSAGTPPSTPGHPPYDIMVSSACYGTTRYKYYYRDGNPYVRYETEVNSVICGYEPPPCDIQIINFVVTDETAEDANNGTVNIFCTSSYQPIMYYLYNADYSFESTTGYFTNVPPGLYQAFGQDGRGCTADRLATVLPFDNKSTHFKYRLRFASVNNNIDWDLRFYDLRNNYDAEVYPKYLEGGATPIIIKQANQDEDKTTSIISKTVEANIIFDGVTFSVDEFTLADPYKWFVELWNGSELEFQGWLLPDETQDIYADPSYPIKLVATDGLPNLKGNSWGDGSGGNGYTDSQVQQYGLKQWSKLLKQCLDQLGYDYGRVIFASSLRFNNTFNGDLWTQLGCWGDLLYDTNGNAIDTYSALDLLLRGMKLTIIQHKGMFVLMNINDLYYANKPLNATEYNRAFYKVQLWDSLSINGTAVEKPLTQLVGYNAPIIPYNPTQSINYDKPYNIKSDLDFTTLAVLYPNPSFEIGAIEGELPFWWVKQGTIDAYLHLSTDAYDGDWTFAIIGPISPPGSNFVYAIEDGFYIDQQKKLINLQFNWKPDYYNDDFSVNAGPLIVFIDTNGDSFIWMQAGGELEQGWLASDLSSVTGFMPPTKIEDYEAWNQLNITTYGLPGTGIGRVYVRFYAGEFSNGELSPSGKPADSVLRTYKIDNFIITIGDDLVGYVKKIGETHTTKVVTGVPQSSIKDLDLGLFTYPENKRVAGNIFIGYDYPTSIVENKWNFALKAIDPMDRLPATITRAFGRNYARPMYIFEGDVQTAYVQFYGTFQLTWYEDRVFIPLSIELDCKNETAHIVLIEISDEDAQFIYKYTPKFERNARRLN